MQGTVFGSLICTAVMDKLAKLFYNDNNLLYKYKNSVSVPILGMVDDVLSVAKCSSSSVASNATLNSFMELNKLKLAEKKCGQIHIGKSSMECPVLKVHNNEMKKSSSEKYLGDIINDKGTLDDTIRDRKLKGYSYLSEIRALLSDMPFGHRRIEIGLMLRDAMFANGILCNSEVWHSIKEKHIEELQVLDRMLLRYITGAHAKVQSEFLYLETGAIPLKELISQRRLMYLHNILSKPPNELLRRVYDAQKKNPVKGDWTELVENDLVEFGINLNEECIEKMTKLEYKLLVKKKIYDNVFEKLKIKQKGHSKIKNISYSELKTQGYMKSPMLNNHEASLLFSLRSRTTKDFKANFPYFSNQRCPLGCDELDTPEHCLVCRKLTHGESHLENTSYNDIFSQSVVRQAAVVQLIVSLLERREDASASSTGPSCSPAEDNNSSHTVV